MDAIRSSLYNNTNDAINNIQIGRVDFIDDENDLGRIKVVIKGPKNRGGDDGKTSEELPWCYPLLPKHLSVVPKKGESVFIFYFNRNREHTDRLYLGPLISQPQKLNKDDSDFGSIDAFTFGTQTPSVAPSTIPDLIGVFPNKEDVSIQGRYNTDITQKTNEVVIRAGKFVETQQTTNNPFKIAFNKKQAFIQLKNDVNVPTTNGTIKGTVSNILAHKINLLTYDDGTPIVNINNLNLISDDELDNIFKNAHQLPFGDILLEYLKLMKNALLFHVHNGNGNPPTDLTAKGNVLAVKSFKDKADELENRMLSRNIRIN